MTNGKQVPEAPKLVCKKCNLRVNTIEWDNGTVRYYHAGGLDLAAAGKGRPDHEPEPVPMSGENFTPLCDFCSARNPAWVIPLEDKLDSRLLTARVDLAIHDDGLWAACDTCKKLVEAKKVRLLHERSVRLMPVSAGGEIKPEVAEMLRLRQEEFWRAKPGRARALVTAAKPFSVHPREVPRLRDDVTAFYRRYESRSVATWLETANLYLVRASQLRHASAMAAPLDSHEGLLGYVPHDEKGEVTAGFMCLEKAVPGALSVTFDGHELPVRAFAWREMNGGVQTVAWALTADAPPEFTAGRETAKLTPVLHGLYDDQHASVRLLVGKEGGIPTDPKAFYTLFCLWYRMTEPRYASTSVDKAPPKDRRKAARKGADPGNLDVTVIDVRHPRQPTGQHSGGGREAGWTMDYREEVSEHSKLVRWGKGRKYVRRVWIDSYERGPEGAPEKARKPEVRVVK